MVLELLLACAPPPDARTLFAEQVVPELEAGCLASSCHGVAPDAEARGEVIDWTRLMVRLDAEGHVADVDAAREIARTKINTVESPDLSLLLRKTLPTSWGGLLHAGGARYPDPGDPGYLALRAWVEAEAEGGEDPPVLDPIEVAYAEEVQGRLLDLQCAIGACHGPNSGVPFDLDPGVGGEVGAALTRANYAQVRRQLSLDGDPSQSRLLRKARSPFQGGIPHRGGDAVLLADDDVAAIEELACAIRQEETGEGCLAPGDPPARFLVVVQGEVGDEPPFAEDPDRYESELVRYEVLDAALSLGEPVVLTEGLHEGAADIRDPAVDDDGERIAFAMRTEEETGHAIWLLDLRDGSARRLTDPGEGSDREPAWGPDGRVWFVSTRDGLSAEGVGLDWELYSVDPDTGETERWSWTPQVERRPTTYRVGPVAGEIAFTALRAAIPGEEIAHPFRFPPGLKTEYHQHFGITPPETRFDQARELPDGRYVTVIGEWTDPGIAGELGIVDRNLGPEIPDDAPPALTVYLPPLTRLAAEGRFRDPFPLPDGRILAARTLDDATFEIVVLTLEEGPEGPSLAAVEPLGIEGISPVAAWTRMRLPEEVDALGEGDHAVLRHQGLAMVDQLLGQLPPSGERVPATGFASVRLLEAVRLPAELAVPIDPADTLHGLGGTPASLSGLHPARVLLELPLAADGTFQAALPVGTAFRIQGLDADGLAMGTPHNRWIDTPRPGQAIPQGIPTPDQPAYDDVCAVCHGTASGRPEDLFGVPDVLTMASVTLSRYEDGDPRRPIDPPAAGEATRVSVDFRDAVLPVLADDCLPCHDTGGTPPELTDRPTTHFVVAYEELLRPGTRSGRGFDLVDGVAARRSYLTELLLGRELDAPGSPPVPEPHVADLPPEDLATLLRWMDAGAPYLGEEP